MLANIIFLKKIKKKKFTKNLFKKIISILLQVIIYNIKTFA